METLIRVGFKTETTTLTVVETIIRTVSETLTSYSTLTPLRETITKRVTATQTVLTKITETLVVPVAILPNLVKVGDLPSGDTVEVDFSFSSPNIVYLASNPTGVWRSDDAGDRWQRLEVGAHISGMAIHPKDPNIFLLGGVAGIIKVVIVESTVKSKVVHKAAFPALAFSPSMPSVAYAADGGGKILRSTDGGETWEAVGQLNLKTPRVAVDPGRPDTLYVATGGFGLFKSSDGGRSWRQVLPDDVLDVVLAAVSPGLIFAAGPGGVFRSADSGSTWRRTLDRYSHSVEVARSDACIVNIGTPEGVFKSSDGGETWASHTTGMEYLNVGPIAVHPSNANTVIVGSNVNLWTRYGGRFPDSTRGEGIYKTIDGGVTWVKKGSEFIDVSS